MLPLLCLGGALPHAAQSSCPVCTSLRGFLFFLCPGLGVQGLVADHLPFPTLPESPEPGFRYDPLPCLCFPSFASRDPVAARFFSY